MRPQRTTLLTLVFAIASLFGASVASAQMSSGEFTYAVEINGVVCGYADVDVSTVKGKHGDYTLFEQQTFMMMSALGSEFNTSVDLTFHIDPASGDFSFMQSHIQQADFTIDATIRIEEGVARCTSTLLTEEEKLVALSDDVLIGNPLYDVHLLGVFADGTAKQVTRPVFDAMEFEVQPTTFTWSGRETLELAGTTFETIIVDTLAQGTGVRSRLWIDVTNGMTVQVEGQLGQRVYLADPSVRKRIELVNRDENILIRTNVTIPNIQRISFMKVEAVLEPTGQWITVEDLNVPGQRFTGTVIENRIEGVFEVEHVHFDGAGAMPYPLPAIDDASLRPYLQPSPFVESGDPVLIRKAEELAAGSADAWDAAVRLSRWVADNITYEIPGGGTARRTYDMRAGECGSHSILLATFCRALGIPSRVVWGCMYTPNLGGAFGQHAWTEVFMGDAGWIPVDSTAHEADFVDSGHIRLGEHQSLSIALNAKSMQVL
ncbi:MAG: transglutaminase-like domain-containing protein, partial [Planctomycetota bacterium]